MYVYNFDLFEFSAAILEKGLLRSLGCGNFGQRVVGEGKGGVTSLPEIFTQCTKA